MQVPRVVDRAGLGICGDVQGDIHGSFGCLEPGPAISGGHEGVRPTGQILWHSQKLEHSPCGSINLLFGSLDDAGTGSVNRPKTSRRGWGMMVTGPNRCPWPGTL